jgi:hypothetical protein
MEKYEDEHYPVDQRSLSPIEFPALLIQESGIILSYSAVIEGSILCES